MMAVAMGLNPFTVLVGCGWAVALLWVLNFVLTIRAFSSQKPLAIGEGGEQPNGDWPYISVLVPARNEEQRVLGECIRSLLAQNYENFEVIAVNDCSTDATGQILRAHARIDRRLKVVEVDKVPAGWLGKPYALHQALSHARGDWLLATDADMIFDPGALKAAMGNVVGRQLDALTLAPRFVISSFWERVVTPSWLWSLLVISHFIRADDPGSRIPLGLGGFFLVRRDVLERVGGYEGLRVEVTEDFRLAEKLKHYGARLAFRFAPELLQTSMYGSLRQLWEGYSKHFFATANYSLPLALAYVSWNCLVCVAPPLIALACAVGLVVSGDPELWQLFVPTFLVWLAQTIIQGAINRRCDVPLVYALSLPVAMALLTAILLDASLRITTGRGIAWKGRKVYTRAGIRPTRKSMKDFFRFTVNE